MCRKMTYSYHVITHPKSGCTISKIPALDAKPRCHSKEEYCGILKEVIGVVRATAISCINNGNGYVY